MKMLRMAGFVLTITAASLFVVLLLTGAGLYAGGIVTNQKISDMVKVLDGGLQSPIESTDAVAAQAKDGIEADGGREHQALVEEWQKEKKSEEEALAARKDAIDAMARTLESVRAELDAREQDFRSRVDAFETAKAAEDAAEKTAGFQEAVKTYSKMDSEDVAKNLYSLQDEEALRYLKALKVDIRASVLTEMQKIEEEKNPGGVQGPSRTAKLIEMLSGGGDVAAVTDSAPVAQ